MQTCRYVALIVTSDKIFPHEEKRQRAWCWEYVLESFPGNLSFGILTNAVPACGAIKSVVHGSKEGGIHHRTNVSC